MIPYAEAAEAAKYAASAMTPYEKAAIMKYAYEESKSLAKTASRAFRGGKTMRKKARRRQRRREAKYADEPATGMLMSVPQAAPNAISSRVKQDYSRALREYRMKHSEMVADIPGSSDFRVTSIRINPGNPELFAWLSAMAPNFESYRFERLRFYLKPQCPTTTSGSTMMVVDGDPVDPPPTSKRIMMTYEGAARAAPWQDSELDVSKDVLDRLPKYFVATQAEEDGSQARLNDLGNLFVATSGQATGAAVSELWVTYELVLMTPQHQTCNVAGQLVGTTQASTPTVTNFGADLLAFEDGEWVVRLPGRYLINATATLASTVASPDDTLQFNVFINTFGIVGNLDSVVLNSLGSAVKICYRVGVDLVGGETVTWLLAAPVDSTSWKITFSQVDSAVTVN